MIPIQMVPQAPAQACENCGAALLGNHCYHCGQPTKGLVRHFSSILGDFFDTVLNVDSRVLHTLWPLLIKPGFLSLEYFSGRRVRYVTPMRLYLFLSVVAFFAIQGSIEIKESNSKSGDHELQFFSDSQPWDEKTNPITFAWLPDSANATLNRRIEHARETIKAGNGEKQIFTAVFNVLPQTLFVLMPIFAVLLKLAYVFKRRLYMEHLIVALHSHSFVALNLTLMLTVSWLQSWLAPTSGFIHRSFGWVIALGIVWMPIYLLLMQKRVYGQGWPMTLLKFSALSFCYFILLSFGVAAAILIGLLTL